jgi:hypothetical protein
MTIDSTVTKHLEALLSALENEMHPTREDFAAIARWRLGCGDANAAARWHRWALNPPPPLQLKTALGELLLLTQQTQLVDRLGPQQGWHKVLLALEKQQPEEARAAQDQAIRGDLALDPNLRLQIAALWQQVGEAQSSLDLLLPVAETMPTTTLCNAIAHLYEQNQADETSAFWWDRSLMLDPCQPAVMIQRSRNALRLNDPYLALQFSQQLLAIERQHIVAQELQVEALLQLDAPASLRIALIPLVKQGRERYLQQASESAAWWRPRRKLQTSWRQRAPLIALAQPRPIPAKALKDCRYVGLIGSSDGLELLGSTELLAPEGTLWNLSSSEPLCSHRNLQKLLPAPWQVHTERNWEPARHDNLDALMICTSQHQEAIKLNNQWRHDGVKWKRDT